MRVLHVYKTYIPENFTGVPRVIHALAEECVNFGVETTVLALYSNPDRVPKTIENHFINAVPMDFQIASTSFSLSVFNHFKNALKNADIVHYHFPWPVADILHLTYGSNKPSIVTYHSDVVKQKFLLKLYSPIMRRFLGSVEKIVATSDEYVSSSSTLARYRDKISVIPIGIEDRKEPSRELVEKWRARVGSNFFLFVGALRYYKGLTFLIEAARQTSAKIVIAGSATKTDVDLSNAPSNIIILGEISEDDKEALLSLSLAFVFPSHLRSEAFGVSLLEASRAGKPMITCEIGTGTSYVNKAGETGLVVKAADSAELRDAMNLLASNSDLAERLGANAKARFARLFTREKMARHYLETYQALLKR